MNTHAAQHCYVLYGLIYTCYDSVDQGNILFDIVAVLDDVTKQKIKDLGGLDAIYFSHPHYYGTNSLATMLTMTETNILTSLMHHHGQRMGQ